MRENLFSMRIDPQDLEILNNNFRQLFKQLEEIEARVNYLENGLRRKKDLSPETRCDE